MRGEEKKHFTWVDIAIGWVLAAGTDQSWMKKWMEGTTGNSILPVVCHNNQSMGFYDGWI